MDLREIGWGYGLNSFGSGLEPDVDSYEHGNRPAGSIKCWELLESLSNCWFLKKDSAPRNWIVSFVIPFRREINANITETASQWTELRNVWPWSFHRDGVVFLQSLLEHKTCRTELHPWGEFSPSAHRGMTYFKALAMMWVSARWLI
jgi:hypothetical protein